MPRIVSYEIGAIFEVGVHDFDKVFVFMPIEDAQTLLMLDLCRRNGADVKHLAYRAVHPVFHTEALGVNGVPSGDGAKVDLWIANGAGNYAMTGTATLA